MLSSATKYSAILDETWIAKQWDVLYLRKSAAEGGEQNSPLPGPGNGMVAFIRKVLEANWGQPWAHVIRETVIDGLERQGWSCKRELAAGALGAWLMECSGRNPEGPDIARAVEGRYGNFARKNHARVEDWGVFSRNLWLLTSLVHGRCVSVENHFREGRRLAAEHHIIGHVYKSKIRKNHIWKSLRGSLFMRRIGKERIFDGIKQHSNNLHGYLTALELLLPNHKRLRSPEGLALQAAACALADHGENNLSFESDPLGYWLALTDGILEICHPGPTFIDDGNPISVEISGRALNIDLPSLRCLGDRFGSTSGLRDSAKILKHRVEKGGGFSPVSIRFGGAQI